MRFLRITLTFVAVWCVFAWVARAQDAFDAPPPHLALVEGTATLDREDVTEPATEGMLMVPGDRLRTERGRAELLFPDGSAIDLDEYSTVELEGPTLLRMTNGRLLLFAAGANNPSSAVQFQIDTPMASAQTDGPGEYRVSILGGTQTEMAIARGTGALVNELGTMPLRSGELSVAWDNVAPSRPQFFNSARYDAFDEWAMALRDERLGSRAQSAQYLPADLRIYGGALDRYGAWNYEAPYGYVWYPTVAPDWRPYYDGYWSPVPIYGWTWIGANRWSWPTHHYGRWGYARSRWFWIPDRHWAPAWVSWGGAPGYVSWCPLGFDNRPVFSLSVLSGNGYRGWNGWNGWTVVSRDHFGGHRSARQFAIGPRSLPANVGFVQQASVPVAPPRAVARRSGNAGQVAGERQSGIGVIGRTGGRGQDVAVPRRGADRPAEGQVTREGRPTTMTRSPQAVSRQPQTNGPTQSFAQPTPPEVSGFRDRPQAVSRQPQVPTTPSAPRTVSPSYDGQNRGFYRTRPPDAAVVTPAAPYENRTNSARSRYGRPSVPPAPTQPIVPATPQRSERPQYGTAMPRSAPIQPPQSVQPNNAQPGLLRRAGPFYSERPTAPPAISTPPPQAPQRQPAPQREERASPPPQERQNDQARPRGRENQQSSGSDGQQNGGGAGHHRR